MEKTPTFREQSCSTMTRLYRKPCYFLSLINCVVDRLAASVPDDQPPTLSKEMASRDRATVKGDRRRRRHHGTLGFNSRPDFFENMESNRVVDFQHHNKQDVSLGNRVDWITDKIAIGNYIEAADVELLRQKKFASALSLDGSLHGKAPADLAYSVLRLCDWKMQSEMSLACTGWRSIIFAS